MGTITASESITLDGVMQAPGRGDEDEPAGGAGEPLSCAATVQILSNS